ncbi:MAG: hypothetical protein Q9163_001734 [Psora crenata]
MAERFLIAFDLKSPGDGLKLETISYLKNLHVTVDEDTLENAIDFLDHNSGRFEVYVDCSAIEKLDSVVALLDAGAAKVLVAETNWKALVKREYKLARLILYLDHTDHGSPEQQADDILSTVADIPNHAAVYLKPSNSNVKQLYDALLQKSKPGNRNKFYVPIFGSRTSEDYTSIIQNGDVAIIPSKNLTMDPRGEPELLRASSLITLAVRSDRLDALLPTVVTDERGVSLGLVYSSHESIEESLRTGSGVYYSRSRNRLWVKGKESGNTQELLSISMDCDADALQFKVRQEGEGFCHLHTSTCFGPYDGISRLEKTLQERKQSAPANSYTAKLFNEPKLLQAKIMEEANELCDATGKENVAAEAADLLYFAITKCVTAGVSFWDIERNLDRKSLKVTRRKGYAKSQWAQKVGLNINMGGPDDPSIVLTNGTPGSQKVKEEASEPIAREDPAGIAKGRIQMRRYKTADTPQKIIEDILQRPSQRATNEIMNTVEPIIDDIRAEGDAALLRYTHKFEKANSLTSPVLKGPFPERLMMLSPETTEAIDVSFENIRRFHAAQKENGSLEVETMPGVTCSRFSRPIERVGLYVPGGTAVLPSTALMLGVPAMVAGCRTIVIASPPRRDGTITPEIVYIAHKVGAESIVLAGGAQAVAALAYGTESVSKVDKILGPGNQFVTAGKMIVSNDTTARVSIDMPAGPSEVLVIADKTAKPAFVASDLLSQAEHGIDSQVILIAIDLSEKELAAIEDELHAQADALPRVDIVRGAIEHSVTLMVKDIEEAMKYSNQYAPEHLILQVEGAQDVVQMVENAGSVFVGPWTPESVGDYSAGVNHSLPTYGYAKQYSGVNLASFTKHITSSHLSKEGLKNVSGAVMQLAKVEELEAHRRAVSIRLEHME